VIRTGRVVLPIHIRKMLLCKPPRAPTTLVAARWPAPDGAGEHDMGSTYAWCGTGGVMDMWHSCPLTERCTQNFIVSASKPELVEHYSSVRTY
jgi:hypothetical protein